MNNPPYTFMLKLDKVGMCYRRSRGIFGEKYWALKELSFKIRKGETLGIIGRNGVGKSTLLRLLAGIIKPDRGEIINFGNYSLALLSLQLGFMPHLTGRENAILSAMLMGVKRHEIEAKMDAIIDFSELGDFFDQPIATYSSGMSARLGFSVAFQVDPDILLVDEVLGVGDEAFNRKSTQMMKEKIRTNKTIVLISHNANLLGELCDRIIWIEDGKVPVRGHPDKVLPRYHDFMRKAAKR
ncbi:ABC transporter ATP-binding protein [Candidatus Venteria ishoeyi]|uniref:Teichoic acids export ATP-binding protein TagH n=1 Tax=Candidatus Venteria ishoeyi TaxID=1899563 RepID=A0A1H6F7T5_9GAMM|nr:ABC transporter ATP-binding protein [Candidatus Venteria ishoeyi]MDM8547436.1 ABC transporter ATP-binding protein [Candidatus Venteria ishoeyi]SEH06197.1 Teichoic acids export ATP-binding protein TagH [Candidatus Venteria ishoeyi]